MKLPEAKKVFAHLMQVARERPLRPLEKETLSRARQVIRYQKRTTATNPKHARDPRTGRLVITDKTDRYWFDKGFDDALLKIKPRNKKAHYIYGYREGKHYMETQEKYTVENPKQINPGVPVPIYGRVLRIEAQKTWSHEYGGKDSQPSQKYFHDFTTKNIMMYGLPDGSLLLKAKGKK